jgi:hypothetical protein
LAADSNPVGSGLELPPPQAAANSAKASAMGKASDVSWASAAFLRELFGLSTLLIGSLLCLRW